MLRSKCEWVEDGEKNTKFFLNLEKKNADNKLICKLEKDDKVIADQTEISNEIFDYYKTLYTESPIQDDLLDNLIVENIKYFIKDEIFKEQKQETCEITNDNIRYNYNVNRCCPIM